MKERADLLSCTVGVAAPAKYDLFSQHMSGLQMVLFRYPNLMNCHVEKPVDALTPEFRGKIATPIPASFISMRMKIYLIGVVSAVSLVSTTKMASSFAGSVLLAMRLI